MATATYTPIATQTLGSAAASITFNSIPGTYTDLRLVLSNVTVSVNDNMAIQFNGDTATNYSFTTLRGNGTSATSTSKTTQADVQLNNLVTLSTTVPCTSQIDVFSYAGSTNKSLLITTSTDTNGAGGVELFCGLWRSTAAITSIKLFLEAAATFSTGTIATLWGI